MPISPLLGEVFLRVHGFSPFLKNQQLQILRILQLKTYQNLVAELIDIHVRTTWKKKKFPDKCLGKHVSLAAERFWSYSTFYIGLWIRFKVEINE